MPSAECEVQSVSPRESEWITGEGDDGPFAVGAEDAQRAYDRTLGLPPNEQRVGATQDGIALRPQIEVRAGYVVDERRHGFAPARQSGLLSSSRRGMDRARCRQ